MNLKLRSNAITGQLPPERRKLSQTQSAEKKSQRRAPMPLSTAAQGTGQKRRKNAKSPDIEQEQTNVRAPAPSLPPVQIPGRAKIIPSDKHLLPFQQAWVRDGRRLKLAEKSRQIGWTWAAAFGVMRRTARDGAKLDAWISSRDDFQARLFLEDCKHFAGIFEIGAIPLREKAVGEKGQSAYVLQFNNGRRIHSVSSNPDAQAGKRGDRILDEFALHQDPRKLYSIAYPGITWGGSLEIFSTHRGTGNFFNELVNEIKYNGNPKGFSLHTVSLKDALDQGFLYKLQSKLAPGDPRLEMDETDYFSFIRSGCADMESFQEEFCCQPSDDNAAFLSFDLIAGCEYPEAAGRTPAQGLDFSFDGAPGGSPSQESADGREHPAGEFAQAAMEGKERKAPSTVGSPGQNSGPLFVGVDVGRDRDLTVIWVLERLGDVMHTRDVICLDRQSFDAQEAVLYELLSRPNLRRCCIDQTGLGRQFAERAATRFGAYRVEGVQFTAGTKEELAYPVRAAFEKKTVRVPNDKFVRADLRSIRKEITSSGNVRFTGERNQNGHADRFWALALALHAAKPSSVQYSAILC